MAKKMREWNELQLVKLSGETEGSVRYRFGLGDRD
jgi:hypothetical protein